VCFVVLAAVIAATSLASGAWACSQCLCGTPFTSDVLGGIVPSQFRYGFEDRYLSKSNRLETGPGTEREREHRVSAFAMWRPLDRLALLGRLPYNVKEITEAPAVGTASAGRSRGFGDAEVEALVGLAQSTGGRRASAGLVFGVGVPTGPNAVADGSGQRLDEHLQPGSGAWTGTAGLQLGVSTPRGAFDASVLGRLNAANAHGYRYGNVLLFNAGYTSPARGGWALTAQWNGRVAGPDRQENGSGGDNTGGSVVYLAPGARWRGDAGLGVDASVQLPVFQSLDGEQTEHATARIGFSLGR
jgi:hypothetical protein